ncbi:MAG TPA: dihydrofolate reductase family protein [Candidatus Saccharimonadales bacterium]|nr:dihydrofolate reductase family protein [Candidatus Saccharimonadales bacterium]
MRRLIYYVACTVDGFIAREDGSFDCFLTEGEHFADLLESFPETFPAHLRDMLGVRAMNKWFDVVLMGRKTYEVGLDAGITNPYPHLKQYLFSSGMKESPDSEVQLVSGDAVAIVKELKLEAGKDIWLCGGGDLATQLFPEIDELILKVNPVMIGSGIPLFRGMVKPTALEVAVSKGYGNGFRLTHYRLKHD